MAILKYWDGSVWINLVRNTFTGTLSTGASWTGSIPYVQDVNVSGLLATDTPHVVVNYSTTPATALLEKEAWSLVSYAETSAGKITFTCLEEKPTQALSLTIEVVR